MTCLYCFLTDFIYKQYSMFSSRKLSFPLNCLYTHTSKHQVLFSCFLCKSDELQLGLIYICSPSKYPTKLKQNFALLAGSCSWFNTTLTKPIAVMPERKCWTSLEGRRFHSCSQWPYSKATQLSDRHFCWTTIIKCSLADTYLFVHLSSCFIFCLLFLGCFVGGELVSSPALEDKDPE